MKVQFALKEVEDVAREILQLIKTPAVLCFNGPMGVGKTTLIKAIIKELGAIDSGSSPTFGLVNEYVDKENALLGYHFDFYRIENELEALDMGFEDYIASNKWLFIEWPEKISSLIPPDSIMLNMYFVDKIQHLDDKTKRFVELQIP
ncbi:tRNA (adenosine(37)-N6)-threonylcarbamoyltransferase complex ATPase subunit type 1 TsaE [Croceivirga thetidis]|uniref:tRNA threonylcarbamoyladenosine biosynthesis protein TsaE n=1 Tax=Croceivirga thetidis TaxID=2721623 RepID=A0ABX1GRG8_9FLAO|nr:tRNA (adenosine(37)-N6)-threonylcarbamoyltransferase complex ATPase subunit type 1 TsaE [Croceivirga thetidis]NKI32223.1 tRNA (adenosine(37)-N6)-threonylcarbamoyltransferase complex ATPase subunit type 1 TsaE [Croceivirga thetidis]